MCVCIYICVCVRIRFQNLYWNACIITFAVYTLHMHMPYGYRHVDHGVFVVISQWIHDKFKSWILTCQLDIVWRQVDQVQSRFVHIMASASTNAAPSDFTRGKCVIQSHVQEITCLKLKRIHPILSYRGLWDLVANAPNEHLTNVFYCEMILHGWLCLCQYNSAPLPPCGMCVWPGLAWLLHRLYTFMVAKPPHCSRAKEHLVVGK